MQQQYITTVSFMKGCEYNSESFLDHVLKPEEKEAMTPDFFWALSEAFNAHDPTWEIIDSANVLVRKSILRTYSAT